MAACRMSEIFHQHVPVLLNEAIDHLLTSKDGTYIDATFGRGSHSREILNRLNSKGRLIAFDKDPEAISFAQQHFSKDPRFSIIHSSFSKLQYCVQALQLTNIQGILFDLGVSSPQLDSAERGFSFNKEGKLDMRMNTTQGEDAMTWLAKIDETKLANILWEYGEEKFSRRIARAIITARETMPITTTTQLAAIIERAVRGAQKSRGITRYEDKHPATRSFQAIRIAVNQELTDLTAGLAQALEILSIGGRLAVISFHSLEDRIVKEFIRQHEKGKELPRGLPIKGDLFNARLKSLGKPIKPGLQEVNINPRARSAILRIAEKKL